MLFYIISC